MQLKLFTKDEIENLKPGMDMTMSEEDFRQLKKSMTEYGFLSPVIVVDGIVVDGNHRLKIARELGISEIPILEIEKKDIDPDVLSITLNLARRHLTTTQKVIFIEKLLELSQKKGVKEKLPKTHEGVAGGIAKVVNVSPTTVKKVIKIRANPELMEKVKTDEISIEQAYQQVQKQKEVQQGTFKELTETEKTQKAMLEPDQDVLQKLRILYSVIRDIIFTQRNIISLTETARLIRIAIQILDTAADVIKHLPPDDFSRIVNDIQELTQKYENYFNETIEGEVC